MGKVDSRKNVAGEIRELREQLAALEGRTGASAKSNPARLSAEAIDQLHQAHREGILDAGDLLDEVCRDANCPDIEADDE